MCREGKLGIVYVTLVRREVKRRRERRDDVLVRGSKVGEAESGR